MRRSVKEWADLALDALAAPAIDKLQGFLVAAIGALVLVTVPQYWKMLIRQRLGSKRYDLARALVPEIDEDEERDIADVAIERMDWVLRKLRMIEAQE